MAIGTGSERYIEVNLLRF
jgi:ubiquitin carboxyl-terminal hydrolase 4/11/15